MIPDAIAAGHLDRARPSSPIARLPISASQIMSTWTIEPITAETREGVIDLFAEVFGPAKAEYLRQRYDWQYRDNPARRPGQITNWALIDEGRVIGHAGFVMVDVGLGDARYQGCRGIDLMVTPSFEAGRSLLPSAPPRSR